MNNKHVNHTIGLVQALLRRSERYETEADYLDDAKEGRSRLATRLREQARADRAKALELQNCLL